MTATEHLRCLLDERGIEHRDATPDLLDDWKNWLTEVRLGDGRWFRIIERQTGDFTFEAFGLNPEQVITAMLGDNNNNQLKIENEKLREFASEAFSMAVDFYHCGGTEDDLRDLTNEYQELGIEGGEYDCN